MAGPLTGIRVVELASFISGPYACMLLGDLGAEVVKLELPGPGDPFRVWSEREGEIRPQFAAYNRGKRSVTCDVGTPGGRAVLLRLVAGADVLLENFRPGTMDRYGVGWETLRATNPRLVYCSVTGMGPSGPYRDRPTYDAIGQALSGLWSQITDLAHPEPKGPPFSDQLTGLFAAYGVLGALVARGVGGAGQRVETSMLSAGLAFMVEPVTNYLLQGEIGDPGSRARRSQSYAFVASDGLPLAIHLSSPSKFWEGLTAALGRDDLRADPRFKGKPERVRGYAAPRAELPRTTGPRPRAEWLALLEANDVPCAPIHDVAGALDDPQARHLGMVRTFGEGARALSLIGFAVSFAATPCEPGLPPPLLGEHTDAVLGAAGYGAAELAALREGKAI